MFTYARTCICATKGQIPPGPLLGKQNIQAKEVNCMLHCSPLANICQHWLVMTKPGALSQSERAKCFKLIICHFRNDKETGPS